MRDVPQCLSTCETLCHVWVVTLIDESQIGMSDHDHPFEFLGVSCHPGSGFSAQALSASSGLSADEGSIAGVLTTEALTAEGLRAGRFDGARIDHYRVNWKAPEDYVHMVTGLIGEVRQKGETFEAEWRGEASRLERSAGRVFSRVCDASFGDTRCGLNADNFPSGTVCPRTFTACRDQFSNTVNYRGFPYLLGDDALVAAPQEGELRDGGSRFS